MIVGIKKESENVVSSFQTHKICRSFYLKSTTHLMNETLKLQQLSTNKKTLLNIE